MPKAKAAFYTANGRDFYDKVIIQVKPLKGSPGSRNEFLYMAEPIVNGEGRATLHHDCGATVFMIESFPPGGAAYIAGTDDAITKARSALEILAGTKLTALDGTIPR